MQEIDEAYIRAIAELPDGFERLKRWIGQMIEDRDTAQEIARLCVAQRNAEKRP